MNRANRLEERNNLLASRFWYWSEVRRLRFDDIWKILEEQEFFVEYQTIRNVLRDNQMPKALNHYLRPEALRKMRKKYPSWNWTNN